MMRRGRRAAVGDYRLGRVLLEELRVPEVPRRQGVDTDLARDAIAPVGSDLVEERRPQGLRLGLAEALKYQRELEHVVPAEHELFPPTRIEQPVPVKGDGLADEFAISSVGACRNRPR